MNRSILLAGLAALQLPLSACSSTSIDTGTSSGGGTTSGGTTTGSSGTSTGGTAAAYPGNLSTWGEAQGNIFPDYALSGGAALNFSTTPVVDSTTLAPSFSFLQLYKLAGFRYAFIDISAVWCPHCNDEAKTLPSTYVPTWLKQGGIVFSILVQSNDPATPASQADLINWISEYKINYPMSLDTEENIASGIGLQGWPTNLIVRLSDMTVIQSVAGATDAFYDQFESVLLECQTTADCWAGATCTNNQCG